MKTQEKVKSEIYDKLVERELVMKQANEIVNSITENANAEVSAINIAIGDLQAELDIMTENEEE
jgi:hypothetical protein